MRYRALDPSGDMTFGQGSANFLVNSPQCVAQAVLTGLRLFQGEFFLDTSAGMPWDTQVVGYGTQSLYDQAIQAQIRNTQGVTGISNYSSSLNKATRVLTVQCTIQTMYGTANISTTLPFAPPLTSGYGVGGFSENPYGE